MQVHGIHHVTAVTAQAAENRRYYTETLGMRLVKRTVNQDDTSAYHLFYADGKATPGTDLTFFDWPVGRERRGTSCICRVGLKVPATSVEYWQRRLGIAGLDFEDFEGQRLRLVPSSGPWEWTPWTGSPVPEEHQIRGLGPVTFSVPRGERTRVFLDRVLGESVWRDVELIEEPGFPMARQGAGGVHHVAFRTPNFEEYALWVERLRELGVANSGPVDRFYFRSLYFREPNGILIEIATDGPGFTADEPLESLGERLALPPFLEQRRAQIEASLKPI